MNRESWAAWVNIERKIFAVFMAISKAAVAKVATVVQFVP